MRIRILAISLIFTSLLLIYINYSNDRNDVRYHNKVINEVFINKGNYINSEYIGYIEIKSLGLKRLIKEGNTNLVLDSNFVLYIERSKPINEIGNTVLAGHSTTTVFGRLHSIKIDDEIIVSTYNYEYKYIVHKIYETAPNDTSIYASNGIKELTLITCTNNNKKRLIVKAKCVQENRMIN